MRDTVMSDDGLWALLGEHGLEHGVRFAKVVDRRLPAGPAEAVVGPQRARAPAVASPRGGGWMLPASLVVALLVASPTASARTVGIEWQAPVEVAAGNGHRGPWRMNESEFRFVDDPTVAVNDAGVTAVAFVDNARKDVLLQIYEPDGSARFPGPVDVSRSPRVFSWLPRILVSGGPADEVHVLWQEIVFSGGSHGGEIFFARSTDGGRTFSPPANLSNTTAGAGKGRLTRRYWHNGNLDLARGARGELYAAWTEYEGRLWFAHSTNGGERFSEPLHVAGDDARPARGPALAVGPDGTVHLAWTVGEDPGANIHLARSVDGGRSFGAPRTPFPGDAHTDAPKIAVGGDGVLHLVFAESPTGPFGGHHVVYARTDGGEQGFTPARTISGPHGARYASVHFPSLGLDGDGRLYVLWELFAPRRPRPQALGITVSKDGGETFAAPALVPAIAGPALGPSGSQQGLLMRKLAVDGNGRLAVVNSTFRENERSSVWLLRGRKTGH